MKQPMIKYGRVTVTVVVGAFVVLGCSSQPATIHLHGEVTVDGQPVDRGNVSFIPESPQQGSAFSTEIRDGRYEADVPAGPLRVYFQATRETGRMIDVFGKPQPETENIIPGRYQGGLRIDASTSDPLQNFHLTTE